MASIDSSLSAVNLEKVALLLSQPETEKLYLHEDDEWTQDHTTGEFVRPPGYVAGPRGLTGCKGHTGIDETQKEAGDSKSQQQDPVMQVLQEKLRGLKQQVEELKQQVEETEEQIEERKLELWEATHPGAVRLRISVSDPRDETGYKHLLALFQCIKELGYPAKHRLILEDRVVVAKGKIKPAFKAQYAAAKARQEQLDEETGEEDEEVEIKDEWFERYDYFGFVHCSITLVAGDPLDKLLCTGRWAPEQFRRSEITYWKKPESVA
jgi:hypothetical protein